MVIGAIARHIHAGGLGLHLAVTGRDKIALLIGVDRILKGRGVGHVTDRDKNTFHGEHAFHARFNIFNF